MFDELDWAGKVPKMSEAGGSLVVGAVAAQCLSCSGQLPGLSINGLGRYPEQH
jgi:hypothetical protein